MTETTEGGMPAVTPDDVALIQAQVRPGSLQPASHLFTLYARLMQADRRPVAHRTSLGHALRAAGWESKRVRQRVGGKPTDVASWFVPGAPPVDEETARMKATLIKLGEGIHPEEMIWETYQRLAREHGWRWTSDRLSMVRWLTRHGFVRMTEKGKVSRYVAPERLAAT